MIDRLTGIVAAISEKTITLTAGSIGFLVYVANPTTYILESNLSFITYFHWNQERGPSIYGFTTELDRKLFLLLIDVQKIGPSLAMQILSQIPAATLIQFIQAEQVKSLSNLHGLGVKKAEQIIHELKSKIEPLARDVQKESPSLQAAPNQAHIYDVLLSLGYSKTEISSALSFIQNQNDGSFSFDQMLRGSLQYLSKNKMI